MVVMPVGLDAATETFLLRALGRDDGYRIDSQPDLVSARRVLDAGGRATIVVIEAAQLHKRIAFPPFVHLIALAGPDRSELRALGADDVVRRPLHGDDLRMRIKLAARALARDYQVSPGDLLRDVLAEGRSGEIIVSAQDDVGRIHLEPGKIAWAHRPRHPVSIRSLFAPAGLEINDETARDLVEESRVTRRHFADVVVDWGLAPRDAVRDCLRAHVTRELAAIFAWDGATPTFVEDKRSSSSSFAFDLEEVMSSARRSVRTATMQGIPVVQGDLPVDPAKVESWLARMSAVPNILGCALLDTRVGAVLGSRGQLEHTADLVWELAGGFSALGPGSEELLATTKTSAYLVRSARPQIPAVAVVTFDPNDLSPAMARILVGKAG